MKREKTSQLSFGDLQLQRRKVKSEFFNQINAVIDWQPLRALIEPAYAKGFSQTGRPCYDCMVLFRIELMRVWYGLSDGEIEEQVNDRLSFSRFAGLGMDDEVPDSTTLCRFRNALVKSGVYDSLLREVNRQLEARRVMVTTGVIVDASVTDSPRRPRGQKEYEVVEDRREDEGADIANAKLVGKPRPGVDVLKRGTPVMADKGYDSAENRKSLSDKKLKCRIMHKAQKNRPLTEREKAVNKAVSKVRYAVERTYGSMHRWFGAGIARYVGLAKTHAQHIMEAIAYNLYRTPGIIVSNCIN